MLQQRGIRRHLTPSALNFASVLINFNESALVPFHLAYIHSGLSSYSRIIDTSTHLVAIHSLRFMRWLGIAYR